MYSTWKVNNNHIWCVGQMPKLGGGIKRDFGFKLVSTYAEPSFNVPPLAETTFHPPPPGVLKGGCAEMELYKVVYRR